MALELTATGPGTLKASGALTFATARAARLSGLAALGGAPGALAIDLSGVTHADSAGLAVLLDWLGAARQAGRKLTFAGLPAGLVALSRISEVEHLLERGV